MSYYLLFTSTSFLLSTMANFILWKLWNRKKINHLRSPVKSDRWGADRIPLTGGIVVFAILMGGFWITGRLFSLPLPLIYAMMTATLMFALGLVDDLRESIK